MSGTLRALSQKILSLLNLPTQLMIRVLMLWTILLVRGVQGETSYRNKAKCRLRAARSRDVTRNTSDWLL
jgi:hypothetical protein